MSAEAAPGPVAAAVAPSSWASARVQGLALVLATACSWGFNWPVTKFLLSELPPFAMRTACCWLGAATPSTRRSAVVNGIMTTSS